MQRGDGWSERGTEEPQPEVPDGAPTGGVETGSVVGNGSDAGTGGTADGRGETTTADALGVAYHRSHSLSHEAMVASF